jgi:hypothetical protein
MTAELLPIHNGRASEVSRLSDLPLADFVTYLPYAALSPPPVLHAPLRGAGHLPRLRIGEATYQRERWEVSLPDLE